MTQLGANGIKTFSMKISYPSKYQPSYKGGADKAFSSQVPAFFILDFIVWVKQARRGAALKRRTQDFRIRI
jgi:hypothetical protein